MSISKFTTNCQLSVSVYWQSGRGRVRKNWANISLSPALLQLSPAQQQADWELTTSVQVIYFRHTPKSLSLSKQTHSLFMTIIQLHKHKHTASLLFFAILNHSQSLVFHWSYAVFRIKLTVVGSVPMTNTTNIDWFNAQLFVTFFLFVSLGQVDAQIVDGKKAKMREREGER